MVTAIHVFIGFVAGLIVMFVLRADAVKYARAAEQEARSLAIDGENAAFAAKEELDKLKDAGANAIGRVEHAGAAAVQQLHSSPESH
ncbi:MAG: hypothetical protein ACJ71W_06005 [Terriglobales bacterium]